MQIIELQFIVIYFTQVKKLQQNLKPKISSLGLFILIIMQIQNIARDQQVKSHSLNYFHQVQNWVIQLLINVTYFELQKKQSKFYITQNIIFNISSCTSRQKRYFTKRITSHQHTINLSLVSPQFIYMFKLHTQKISQNVFIILQHTNTNQVHLNINNDSLNTKLNINIFLSRMNENNLNAIQQS
eukprot:TRINITY_DN1524_c0_g1_i8.p1 TRINITY_DN1524_c0_g1~~TRINITY_DN1524_c0_g1_i8.p1  ORF type:complete len:185 (+),score=-26.22 TRINITY_DN1524_c0_g1_i8:620-1174(+)